MKRNQHPKRCSLCGQMVESGAGFLETRRNPETFDLEHIVTHEVCPEPGQGKAERPRWAVPGEGLTPRGNSTTGYRLTYGDDPGPEAVPVNDAAKAVRGKANG